MEKPPKYNASDYVPYKGISRTPGQTIKALREMSEWSQVELAEKTGISQATISSLETGRTTLGAERAKIIAKAFNIYPGIILFSDWRREDYAA
jgi:transcriptional regulator with XRE-family HTH domain